MQKTRTIDWIIIIVIVFCFGVIIAPRGQGKETTIVVQDSGDNEIIKSRTKTVVSFTSTNDNQEETKDATSSSQTSKQNRVYQIEEFSCVEKNRDKNGFWGIFDDDTNDGEMPCKNWEF